MKKQYVLRFICERDIENFMDEVYKKTKDWFVQPVIRKEEGLIEFAGTVLMLTVDDRMNIDKCDPLYVAPIDVIFGLDRLNNMD